MPRCSLSYVDGSTVDARIYSDVVELPGLPPVTYDMNRGGCHAQPSTEAGKPVHAHLHGRHVAFCRADVSGVANETGVFQRGTTDGILALAHQNGSSMYERTGRRLLIETLVDGRNVAHDAFALCLEPGGVGGFLALGAPPLEGMNVVPVAPTSMCDCDFSSAITLALPQRDALFAVHGAPRPVQRPARVAADQQPHVQDPAPERHIPPGCVTEAVQTPRLYAAALVHHEELTH
jgi:hypothetical protein